MQYISGTIMFDETLFQSSRAGVPFVDILKKQGILPGIKVDTGLQPIDGTDGETATQGLDGLAERCQRCVGQSPLFSRVIFRTR
jgi:fructose-bisphosphate aldolase class I